jgi:XTP/dITP diphosphohydrolase
VPTTPDAPRGRVVLLSTSPRVAPGLLSGPAWSVLRAADDVRAAPDHPLLPYLAADGIDVSTTEDDPRRTATDLLDAARSGSTVVWLVGGDGDPELGRALGAAAEAGGAPEIELLPASYDLPGARLLDLVDTMDRLRSPGGCPWDAEQTHRSLTTYLVEETYEVVEAIETDDRSHLREELGDLLLQIAFHARIAAEHPSDPWTVDDVAGDIVDKLVRRHPHVFGPDVGHRDAAEVEATWHTLKAAEKGRESAVEGVPPGLPALALTAKLMHRARSHGVLVDLPPGEDLGSRLLALVAEAQDAGLDPEAELRAAARGYADRVRAAERATEISRTAAPGDRPDVR